MLQLLPRSAWHRASPIGFSESYRVAGLMHIHVLKWRCERLVKRCIQKKTNNRQRAQNNGKDRQYLQIFQLTSWDIIVLLLHTARQTKIQHRFYQRRGSLRLLSLFLLVILYIFTLPNKLSTLNKAWVGPHKERHTDDNNTATQLVSIDQMLKHDLFKLDIDSS